MTPAMNVLFVYTVPYAPPPPARPLPDWTEMSLGISYLASTLESAGHTIRLVVLRREGARFAPPAELTFKVVPRKSKPNEPDVSKPIDVPWGKAKGGFRTRVRASTNKFFAGEPIPVVVEIENISDRILYYHVPQIFQNNRAKVLDIFGEPVPYIAGSACTTSRRPAMQ